jgi:hypothetical protein
MFMSMLSVLSLVIGTVALAIQLYDCSRNSLPTTAISQCDSREAVPSKATFCFLIPDEKLLGRFWVLSLHRH